MRGSVKPSLINWTYARFSRPGPSWNLSVRRLTVGRFRVEDTWEVTLGDIIAADVRDLFDSEGNLRHIKSLTRQQASQIASFEVVLRDVARNGRLDVVHKIRLVDRSKYIEMAAKHFSLLVENLNVAGGLSLVDERASDESFVIVITGTHTTRSCATGRSVAVFGISGDRSRSGEPR